MISAILGIINKTLDYFLRRDERAHKPEALRKAAQGEIDQAVSTGDADRINALLDNNLKRLQDRRRGDSKR